MDLTLAVALGSPALIFSSKVLRLHLAERELLLEGAKDSKVNANNLLACYWDI